MNSERKSYPVATIAKLLNLTERRIQQLAKDGVIPKPEHGQYDLIGSVQGYIAYLKNKSLLNNTNSYEERRLRIRLLSAKAEKAEIEIRMKRDELIPDHIAFDLIEEMNLAIRARLLVLPNKMSPLLTNRTTGEIEKLLKDEVYEALTELSSTPFPDKVLEKLEKQASQDNSELDDELDGELDDED